jgi:hypothetical protein
VGRPTRALSWRRDRRLIRPTIGRITIRVLAEERSGQAVEAMTVWLELDDGISLTTRVTPLDAGTYRLEETEWVAELFHHDIIQAEDLGSGRLRYIRVVQRSELLVTSGIFSEDFLDSAEVLSELNWLTRRGGYWQREMGGCLLLSIPKDVETAFDARWEQVLDSHRRSDRQ